MKSNTYMIDYTLVNLTKHTEALFYFIGCLYNCINFCRFADELMHFDLETENVFRAVML